MQSYGPAGVDMEQYARFLPQARKDSLIPPVSEWWTWRKHLVHLLRLRDANAPVRVIVVHGAGAHGGALWPVVSMLAGRRIDLAAVDLPLYGRTVTASRGTVRYEDWIALLVDLVAAEDDGRPVILLGASIGGMLTVEAAARSHLVAAVVATCLLDPTESKARSAMTRFGSLALAFVPVLRLVRGPLAQIPLRISWIANLRNMGRDPGLGRLCANDARGGGAWVPLGFLASYIQHPHSDARIKRVPVHLMHPELDEWTPVALSGSSLQTLPGPTTTRLLRSCGHFPLEEPGLQDLLNGIEEVAAGVGSGTAT
ncbi:alpha/beta hydrolase [Glutamicibacter sp. AOP38-B1-38]|uniref:alpha/beta hydrolase n=1 Tax=Glutamicibacter sp. AOP38-B1-38 TaxID=3457680 RepID=UPI004034D99F